MNHFGEKVSFIWSVADLLRGPYKPHQYGDVILPMTVLRRLDCVLEPTNDKVLTRLESLKGKAVTNIEPILDRVAGQKFHNTSKLDFDDDVALKYYRLQKISESSIALQPGEVAELKGPTALGTGKSHEEQVELSQLIDVLNERFGTDFKPADQLFLDSAREDAVADEELRQAATANTIDNFK